ncbi:MAG TPA: hypothetical protein VGO47_06590 [Chlamydiales bacterium]|nr:hypothetical protein [Chlamydiales bacterium]
MEEEFRRTECSFRHMSEVWQQLGTDSGGMIENPGKSIYAYISGEQYILFWLNRRIKILLKLGKVSQTKYMTLLWEKTG